MAIRFIITGGTIGKKYDPLSGELDLGESHIPEIFKRARFTGDTTIQIVMMKDSLDMIDDDRLEIKQARIEAEETAIVITHDTDSVA